jgi:asparagine synthase (glutamine-hydrolysing)
MCGIAGVVSSDSLQRAPDLVRNMVRSLVHRGPDDEGVEHYDGATLAARRLAIIDLVSGHQPVANSRGDVFAIQNGEIYNFRELRDQLERAGHRFRTQSDTEILPHAYDEWGLDFVTRLRGMFAIALWDARDRMLVLARDRFGKKPLVYAHVGNTLIFGSEIQAVRMHPLVTRTIDDVAIGTYLVLGYVPAPRTGFADIRKIAPAHVVTFRDNKLTSRRYWEPKYSPKVHMTRAEAASALREKIDEAVRIRMTSDVPLGAFLSGGLDSSTVVALMARHSAAPVKTFSIGFKDQSYDELRYARLVAERFATDHHEFVVDASDAGSLPMLVRHLGEPFADSSIVPTYQVARITRSLVTVALNGDGGDEIFGGYNHYRAAAAASRLAASPHAVLAAISFAARAMPDWPSAPRWVRVGSRFSKGLSRDRAGRYLDSMGHFYGKSFLRIAGERTLTAGPGEAELIIQQAMTAGSAESPESEMGTDVRTYLPGDLLVKMDIATMAASLEARSPLLDHELAEFVAQLPPSFKVSLRGTKLLLREAMRNDLPHAILSRRKMGLSAPVGAWLRGPLRDLFREVVLAQPADRGFVSSQEAAHLFEDHQARRADNARLLWTLLMLELWFRECVDHNPAISAQEASLHFERSA